MRLFKERNLILRVNSPAVRKEARERGCRLHTYNDGNYRICLRSGRTSSHGNCGFVYRVNGHVLIRKVKSETWEEDVRWFLKKLKIPFPKRQGYGQWLSFDLNKRRWRD